MPLVVNEHVVGLDVPVGRNRTLMVCGAFACDQRLSVQWGSEARKK